jgi:hypothetical protein
MWLILFLVRCKYYFGWYMGEGGFVACGFSYNGTDARGRVRWCVAPPLSVRVVSCRVVLPRAVAHACASHTTRDRVPVNRPLGVELPENMREVTDSWNICTSSWLKQCTRLARLLPHTHTSQTYPANAVCRVVREWRRRVPAVLARRKAQYVGDHAHLLHQRLLARTYHPHKRMCRVCVVRVVRVVCSMSHLRPATHVDQGFYPGYFMFFLMGAVITETGKGARVVSCRVTCVVSCVSLVVSCRVVRVVRCLTIFLDG